MKLKCTVISLGAFGLSKQFIYLHAASRRDYAQYKSVLSYDFTEKGKRKAFRAHCASSSGRLTMIFPDWQEGLIYPCGMEKTEHGTRSRFASFDQAYTDEARAFFQSMRDSGAKILLDAEMGYMAPELTVVAVNA